MDKSESLTILETYHMSKAAIHTIDSMTPGTVITIKISARSSCWYRYYIYINHNAFYNIDNSRMVTFHRNNLIRLKLDGLLNILDNDAQ